MQLYFFIVKEIDVAHNEISKIIVDDISGRNP